MKKDIQKVGISMILFILAIGIPKTWMLLKIILYLCAYVLAGYDVLYKAYRDIKNKEPFGECLLMTIATVGAFGVGFYHIFYGDGGFPEEFSEGVAVMLFYQIGELFQSYAVRRSRTSISNLMDIRPDYAMLKKGDDVVKVDPFEVQIGDVIVVRPGEKVPLDGQVVFGSANFDTAALTGESMPRHMNIGDEILSGCINQDGVVEIRVEKEFIESTASKILDLVENAAANKAKTERFITKFSRIYTPIVVGLALGLILIPGIWTGNWITWILRALNFLIVSCPCALVVSVPLSFFGGIGGASKRGILIKGSNYFELLANTGVVVFDKTGTLTEGKFQVQEIHSIGISKEEFLHFANMAEMHSSHPIAVSIRNAYESMQGKECKEQWAAFIPSASSKKESIQIHEIAGKGVEVWVEQQQVLFGNIGLMRDYGIALDEVKQIGTVIYLSVDKKYCGYLVIADCLKSDSVMAIQNIHALGIEKTVMLTGDRKEIGEMVAKELGMDEVYTQLLPGDKVAKVEEILDEIKDKTKNKTLLFVGDGINDAPVLARADVGIAMGGIGSDAAIEAADVVIMQDQPSQIALAIKVARHTMQIVKQNIWGAIVVKVCILILSAFGFANMWMAVFGDVGVTILAILNSFRALYTEKM